MPVSSQELASLFPLESLRPESRQYLAREALEITAGRGERVFEAGDIDEDTVYVTRGAVRCDYPDGRSTLHQADSLVHGRYPLNDAVPRRFRATVHSREARLLRLNRRQVEKLIAWDQISRQPQFRFFDPRPNGNEWAYRLLQAPAFRRLPTGNLEKLFQLLAEQPVAPGEVVMNEGDPPGDFYVIRQGTASVTKTLDGAPKVVAYLAEGDAFGEDGLLSNQPRNATVRMLQGGQLLRLSRSDFEAVLKPPVIRWLLPAEAARKAQEGAIVLDVRLPEEVAQRSIAGALNIPLARLREEAPAQLPPGRPVIVYCNTGERSAAAAFVLSRLEFEVAAIHGGLSAMLRLQAQQQAG
ncbi:MAG: cyclic nucleotide-binding domain-containing protein [Silanimonas lenta]